jgi:protease I
MSKRAHESLTASADLSGKRVAFVVDEMFEDSEFRVPYDRVREAGYEAVIVGVTAGKQLTGKKHKEKIRTDKSIDEVHLDDFSALVLPGGYSPDHLRMNERVVEFVRDFVDSGKPCAAICHAPWLLAEGGVSEGRTMTSWPSIKTDLINAGANWVDREVVEDGNLITSRKPDDLDAFCEVVIRQLEHGAPEREVDKKPRYTAPGRLRPMQR